MQASKLLAVSALVLWAIQVVEAKTYEEVFTDKAGRAYSEDINVWVYTSEFAERFAMPKEWVDNDLRGAYAVAFRVETASGKTHFPHKGPNVSMVTRRCILDVYVDDKAPIPWADDQTADFWFYTPSSPTYLLPQTDEDFAWRQRPIGIPVSGNRAKWPLIYMGLIGNKTGGSVNIREYDKTLYPGISYISLNRSCMTPPQNSSWIEFMRDGNWNYGKHDAQDIAHRIEIPRPFMARLYELWFDRSRKRAIEHWRNVIK